MVTISPVGVRKQVENMLTCLATYSEDIKEYCQDSLEESQYSVVYTHGTAELHGESVFVPVTAVITILVPCYDHTTKVKMFNEDFMAVIQEQTKEPTFITITSVGSKAVSNDTAFTIYDSLEIFIA